MVDMNYKNWILFEKNMPIVVLLMSNIKRIGVITYKHSTVDEIYSRKRFREVP